MITFCILGPALGKPEWSVYIRNKPYSGPVLQSGKEVYVDIEKAAKLLKLNYFQQGESSCQVGGDKKEPCPVDLAPNTPSVTLNGKTVTSGITQQGGKMFISLRTLAKTLGAVYDQNSQTGIIDLSFPSRPQAQGNASSTQTPSGTPKYTLYYYYRDT